jgi:hypothetical protein
MTATGTSTSAAPVSLCVGVTRSKPSSQRGHPVQWTVSAWATGGNIADATVQLRATPASGGTPGFSFGCGKGDGKPSCDLGTVDAKSAQRQLQARLTVPATASAVKSVRLTVIGSAAHLAKAAEASATVAITAPPRNTSAQSKANVFTAPQPVTAPLPVGSLPSIPAPNPTLSPGGNAAGLFPTLDPKPTTSPARPDRPAQSARRAHTLPIADTSALPVGAPVVGAQLAGLAALALAFVLAITRLSIRRRPAAARPAKARSAKARPAADTSASASATEGSDATSPKATPDTAATDGE